MALTYTYDPSLMAAGGKDQMRFELQDIAVDGGRETCALSDEEYEALIASAKEAGKGFRYAKYRCLDAIVMKMAWEVDFSADGLSLSLSQRYERWKAMLKDMRADFQRITANPAALGKTRADGGHYFYAGMHDNPRATMDPGPFREV